MSKARGLAALGNAYNDGALSNRNLIINGAMQVAQRGTSYSGSTFAGYYTVDRFRLDTDSSGTLTTGQDSDAPTGFGSSYKIDCTVADASPNYTAFYTKLEGQNLQSIGKGTSDAKEVTVSFWVKTNLVGTYPLNLRDTDNDRWCYLSYAVATANTWEHKTVTFPADTTGSLDNDANDSLTLEWWFSAGASYTGTTPTSAWVTRDDNKRADLLTVNMGSSTSNYINITGVQLEVGDTATPFEHRSYGDELARCQRYFRKFGRDGVERYIPVSEIGVTQDSYRTRANYMLSPAMRTVPSLSQYALQVNNMVVGVSNSVSAVSFAGQEFSPSSLSVFFATGTVSGQSAGQPAFARVENSTTGYFYLDAEL
jgi:hypothetical protein